MTLKGGVNHYNVKFLKGYRFSIKVKDSKIALDGTVEFDFGDEEEGTILDGISDQYLQSVKGLPY